MSHIFLLIPSGMDLILIAGVVFLLFGGKKFPELMKGIGTGIREFNAAKAHVESEIKEGMKEPEKKELPKKD